MNCIHNRARTVENCDTCDLADELDKAERKIAVLRAALKGIGVKCDHELDFTPWIFVYQTIAVAARAALEAADKIK